MKTADYASKHPAIVFQLLLENCDSWLHEDENLISIPSIHMHIDGGNTANDKKHISELTPWSFIYKVPKSELQEHNIFFHNVDASSVQVDDNSSSNSFACVPSFGVLDYISP